MIYWDRVINLNCMFVIWIISKLAWICHFCIRWDCCTQLLIRNIRNLGILWLCLILEEGRVCRSTSLSIISLLIMYIPLSWFLILESYILKLLLNLLLNFVVIWPISSITYGTSIYITDITSLSINIGCTRPSTFLVNRLSIWTCICRLNWNQIISCHYININIWNLIKMKRMPNCLQRIYHLRFEIGSMVFILLSLNWFNDIGWLQLRLEECYLCELTIVWLFFLTSSI